MSKHTQAFKQETEMVNSKTDKKQKKPAQADVRKAQPIKTATETSVDPGCRPSGT